MSRGKSKQLVESAEPSQAQAPTTKQIITISPPNFQTVSFIIEGIEPLVQNKFSKKAQEQMIEAQKAGSTARKGKKREAKDFEGAYKESQHISTEGWGGIPASAFRAGMVSACRTVGFKMTLAKLSVFVFADGQDADGTPLIKITKGTPSMVVHPVRNQTGVADMRVRAMWKPGWRAIVRIQYDGDQFTATDITNLFMRMGLQVGVGEGRPDSKESVGMNWGRFVIVNE